MRGVAKLSVNLTVRATIALLFALACFFLISLRLWYLQVLRGDDFRGQSENNRLRTVYTPPIRGLIRDRNGKDLVKNRPSFNIELIAEDAPKPKETLTRLAHILGYEPEVLIKKVQHQRKRRRFEPKEILRDVSRDVIARVVARRHLLPGVVINVTPGRDYIYGDLAAHTLGYIREITRDQLESPHYAKYRQGDLVGQFGIENRWEWRLQGERGIQEIVVNAMGTRIGEASFTPASQGETVYLTLDLEVQRAADMALTGKKGALVAMDVNTGEILALSSAPRFDPNAFTGDVSPDAWRDLVSGADKKLSNRAVQGAYPPGSTFKIFMAIAGLSEGAIGEFDRINCPGFLHFGKRNYFCHKKTGHGPVAMKEAVIQSCDVYFYTLGERLGIDRIHDYAVRFGLGQKTGLNLVEESPGLIPSTEWKRRYFKRPEEKIWFPGETLSVVIGQGAVLVTPLQLARAIAAVVNGGRVFTPQIVKKITTADEKTTDNSFKLPEESNANADPRIVEKVKDAMVGVVNDPRGTGHKAVLSKEFNITVGGKSGTSQVVGRELGLHGDKYLDHAWFVGYAPAEKPEIVVAALVENGGHGGAAAAPLVKQVMEAYFLKTHPPPPPEKKEEEAEKSDPKKVKNPAQEKKAKKPTPVPTETPSEDDIPD